MAYRYDWLPQDSWVYLGPAFHALARDLDTLGTPTPRDQVTAASPATAVAPYLPPADTAGRSRSPDPHLHRRIHPVADPRHVDRADDAASRGAEPRHEHV